MLKRKRPSGESVEEKFASFRNDLFRALKAVKGLERQRQGKRLRDPKAAPEKAQRLSKEIVVLKSLDLHQSAHAHLCASLLKFKAIAGSPNLPKEIQAVPKPDISEEERTALHNVTSALYNRKEVRDVIEKAIPAICNALGVQAPEKKGQGKNERDPNRRQGKEDQPADRDAPVAAAPPTKQKKQTPDPVPEDASDEDEDRAISQFEAMLGGSSSEEQSGTESDDELDPMAVTSDEEEDPMAVSPEEEEWGGFEDSDTDAKETPRGSGVGEATVAEESSADEDSASVSPPPKRAAKPKSTSKQAKPGDSTFLPTLMGGYISGSESASDVDIGPPRKNRRGQKARQAIWEKKYKEKAKHLAKESKNPGWDPKRGAVEDTNKPWKRGIKNPFEKTGANTEPLKERPKPPKPEDTGPLHPSWEARKKAKEKQETATFQGKKITFD